MDFLFAEKTLLVGCFTKFIRSQTVDGLLVSRWYSAVARVSEAPPEISRGAPHTVLAYYYELQ